MVNISSAHAPVRSLGNWLPSDTSMESGYCQGSPSGQVAPVVPHLLLPLLVGPDLVFLVESRGIPDLLLRDVGVIPVKPHVVGELFPRDGVVVNPQSQKAAERHIDVD